MVRFIVKAPLTNDQIRPSILHALDHVRELLLLVLPQLLVLLHTRDVQLVLSLRARRLEGARENRKARIFDGARHARVRHVLVDEDAFDELDIRKRTADFPVDFDEIEKNVPAGEVCDREDGVDSNLGKVLVVF
jgi:hypothetical protein